MRRTPLLRAWALLLAASGLACEKPVRFPAEALSPHAGPPNQRAYDTDGDGKGDFFGLLETGGRIDRIAYDDDGDGRPDTVIPLDAIPFGRCRHLVIILDGVGFDLAKAYRDAGRLRVFHPPSRVIAPYPTLTDPCLEDILGYMPCRGMEAEYYDRRRNRVAGGAWAYLTGRNAPYNRLLHYRASLIWDAVGYILPWKVYGKEVNDAKRLFDRARTQEVLAYFVSSAGVGTARGAEGHRMCLRRVEQLVHQVLWETRGLVKITLLADHGHSYTPAKRAPIEDHLRGKGWRLASRLRRPEDVVYIRFGLETYASFATNRPAALAADLVACEGIELASYADGETVVVLAPGGRRAVVRRKAGRYGYEPQKGDPLKLGPILGKLGGGEGGFHDADELLRATARHEYPAPLQRLWRAHFAIVECPPDVIASLGDGWYSGSQAFGGAVRVASTHGSLNYRNSATFIMSTIGPLPEVLRSADVPKHMKALTGRNWPTGR